jgi:electron transfer flavoprotein beta subunit
VDIIVTVKEVTDPNIPPSYVKLDAQAKRIVSPFGVAPVLNGYDENALEEALRLRERHGGRVTVLSLGDDSSRKSLKRALAMGADAAILLSDPIWMYADSATVGRALAAAIRKIGKFDLVMCGRQASDTDAGQVLYWIAESLKLPAVSPVARIAESEPTKLTVHRLIDGGHQRLRVQLPALLGVSSEINEPRHPTMRGTMNAGRALVPGWKLTDLGIAQAAPKVELRRLTVQTRTTKAQLIDGSSDADRGIALADKLRDMGLV